MKMNKAVIIGLIIVVILMMNGTKKEAESIQHQCAATYSSPWRVQEDWYQSQTFTTSNGFDLEKVKVVLKRYGSPTGNINLALRATSNGAPTGGNLFTISKEVNSIPTDLTEIEFILSSPYALQSSTTYAIILYGPSGIFQNFIGFGAQSGNPCPDGVMYESDDGGVTWNPYSRDAYYKLYGEGTGGSCNNQADTNSDCSITLSEVIGYAEQWINNQGPTLSEVINTANIWINGGSY